MSFIAWLSTSQGELFTVSVMAAAAVMVVLAMFVTGGILDLSFLFGGSKVEKVWIANRVKPDVWEYDFKARMGPGKGKGPQEMILRTSKKKRFLIPTGKEGEYHRVYDGKKWHKVWYIEGGQIVQWSQDLGEQSNPLLDQETVTAVQNRGSARRLAAQSATGDRWIYLIMGAAVAFALAWVAYPMLNHPAPALIYCTRLLNGTVIPKAICPG
jgi:hypothetical protein